jgi:predicted RNA-binding Zn-ribbon protein involved in translation (DUF1610 family)
METKKHEPNIKTQSSKGDVVKSWRDSDFECPECGENAKVCTDAVAPYYWDGDKLQCPECGLKGGVQCDEDGATDIWDW